MPSYAGSLSAFLASFADLVLGERCAGCGGAEGPLCHDCADVLDRRPHQCRPRPGCPPVWAGGPYAGRDRSVLLAFKNHGARALARPLGRRLAAVYAASGWLGPGTVLVPVPARASSARRRGHDPVPVLARAGIRQAGGAAAGRVLDLLEHRRAARPQVGLGRRERRENLRGALAVRPRAGPLQGTDTVIVDDVLTTGATVADAARALREAGAHVLGAVVVVERG